MINHLVVIVGPTAIGKTALSIKLANYFKTEIVSSDSRQFYKEMQIGTAAPTITELQAAPHHFIHHKSVEDHYNVGDFERDAISKLEQLFKKHHVVIMVGGSGLYVDAVIKGLDEFPKVNPEIRSQLNKRLKDEGLESLQIQLKNLDETAYNKIAIDNPHRVTRALEVCLSSGKPYSTFLTSETKKRNFKTIVVGLSAERELIYNKINQRVDLMIANGLLDEAKSLIPQKYLNALNTVGYKELFKYFDGEWDLDFAVSEIKKNTRRFAKRQLTWFRKHNKTIWFDTETDINQVVNFIEDKIKDSKMNNIK